jgi:hypothetical protein
VIYDWGYHSADPGHAHVSGDGKDLFDVTFYDPDVVDPESNVDCQTHSLHALQRLIDTANQIDAIASLFNPHSNLHGLALIDAIRTEVEKVRPL